MAAVNTNRRRYDSNVVPVSAAYGTLNNLSAGSIARLVRILNYELHLSFLPSSLLLTLAFSLCKVVFIVCNLCSNTGRCINQTELYLTGGTAKVETSCLRSAPPRSTCWTRGGGSSRPMPRPRRPSTARWHARSPRWALPSWTPWSRPWPAGGPSGRGRTPIWCASCSPAEPQAHGSVTTCPEP